MLKIYVVKNIAMETAGYFTNREAATRCAEYNHAQFGEKWFVIEVEVKDMFNP